MDLPTASRGPYPLSSLLTAAHTTRADLARTLRVSWESVYGWEKHGLTWSRADEAAVAYGLHPSTVWGDTWWEEPPTVAPKAKRDSHGRIAARVCGPDHRKDARGRCSTCRNARERELRAMRRETREAQAC